MDHVQLFENFDSPKFRTYDKSSPPRPIGDTYKDAKLGDLVEITGVAVRLSNKNSATGLTNNSRFNTKVMVNAIRVTTEDGTLFLVNTSAIDMETRMNVNKVFDGTRVTLKGTIGRTKLYEPANQMCIMLFKVEDLKIVSRVAGPTKPKAEPREKTEDELEFAKLRSRFISTHAPSFSIEDKRAYWAMTGPEKKVFITDYMLHADKSRDGYKINRAGAKSDLSKTSDPSKLTATEARVLKAFDLNKKYDMSREDFAAYLAGDDRVKYNLAIKNN